MFRFFFSCKISLLSNFKKKHTRLLAEVSQISPKNLPMFTVLQNATEIRGLRIMMIAFSYRLFFREFCNFRLPFSENLPKKSSKSSFKSSSIHHFGEMNQRLVPSYASGPCSCRDSGAAHDDNFLHLARLA